MNTTKKYTKKPTLKSVMSLIDLYGEECKKHGEYDNNAGKKEARDWVKSVIKDILTTGIK